MWARLLEERTALDVDHWNRRIRRAHLDDEKSLRAWLTEQKVTGYAQSLLVMERFGYPDFLLATADELIDRQYADRPQIRPIYDAIILAASGLGEVIIQARKTYVSLVSPRRTFARVQATTKNRVDLGLRLEKQKPGGRLQPSKIHETMRLQVSLTSPDEVDSEVLGWLQRAYDENR
jgi:urease accessory protein UreE